MQAAGPHKALEALVGDESLELCRQLCPISHENLPGLTIQGATDMERSGLPFHTTIIFYILAYTREKCSVPRGGKTIPGYLRRLLLFASESGVQELLLSENFPLSACPHERLRWRNLSWVQESHRVCCESVGDFSAMLQTLDVENDPRALADVSFSEYFLNSGITMVSCSTWKPGLNARHIGLAPVIQNLVFGEGNWQNVFGKEVPVKFSSGGDLYCLDGVN